MGLGTKVGGTFAHQETPMLQTTLALDSQVPTTSAPSRASLSRFLAGAAALSILGALLVPLLPDSVVDPASPLVKLAHASSSAAVASRTDPSVPDASAVFIARETPVVEAAPTF
jgi:hypothetical protein